MRPFARVTVGALCALLAACASIPTPSERAHGADALAAQQGWQAHTLQGGRFQLRAYLPSAAAADTLSIYLEGDGLAWLSRSRPSSDPTPLHALGLQLALAQPEGTAAYVARPCQFIANQAACSRRYWTDARFAPEVVASLNDAVSQLKARFRAKQLVLVGYSGGGAIALLLAARRDDVQRVITVAGNLDPHAWATHHRLTALSASLSPADQRDAMASVPQQHLVGEQDTIVPPELAQAFVAGYAPGSPFSLRVLPRHDHACCWAAEWPTLWRSMKAEAETRLRRP